jgi:ABC-type tungstate transport system substrate-binding protein
VALLLALLAAGLFAAALATGMRRHRLTLRGLLAGVFAFPAVTIVATLVTFFSWLLLKRAVPDLRVFSLGSDQNAFFVFGLLALALAVFAAVYQPPLRRARRQPRSRGACLVGGPDARVRARRPERGLSVDVAGSRRGRCRPLAADR